MKQKPTDDLIADVLAMGMEIRQHLEDKRRRLTPLQMEGLSNAVTAIRNYFFSWKAHNLARRDTTAFPRKDKSANAHTSLTRQRATPSRERQGRTG